LACIAGLLIALCLARLTRVTGPLVALCLARLTRVAGPLVTACLAGLTRGAGRLVTVRATGVGGADDGCGVRWHPRRDRAGVRGSPEVQVELVDGSCLRTARVVNGRVLRQTDPRRIDSRDRRIGGRHRLDVQHIRGEKLGKGCKITREVQ